MTDKEIKEVVDNLQELSDTLGDIVSKWPKDASGKMINKPEKEDS